MKFCLCCLAGDISEGVEATTHEETTTVQVPPLSAEAPDSIISCEEINMCEGVKEENPSTLPVGNLVLPTTRPTSSSLTNDFSEDGWSYSFNGSCNSKWRSLIAGKIPEEPTWVEKLRPELKEKIRKWVISFHHMDPRYQILTFFNIVAEQGADKMCDDMSDNDNTAELYEFNNERASQVHGMNNNNDVLRISSKTTDFLNSIFNCTSILTVWRPTSNEAMRKMMIGEGVGKGLDIKGKSAKRGALSAFVPFMQIHEEDDKQKVSPISEEAKLRVYYASEGSRKSAIRSLKSAQKMNVNGGIINSFLSESSAIKPLNKYSGKGLYGLEVSQQIFWKAYILDQDITRDEDSNTGRPSTPGFQDSNLKTLRLACALENEPSPFPVVKQLHKENAMDPKYLVMAYEENNTVTPVVSDFDGFLMGWRREALWFGCNLPREQERLMMWSIKQIQKILEEPSDETWTMRWLEVLKEEAKLGNKNIPEMPQYGFGDPKSYSIMEEAAKRLISSGAVRHGSECFNYSFPQEIDDYFLIISDTFHPVPWKYVSSEELPEILTQKIRQGFVFPLNPKWIVCDPGWKKVYDALMDSDALYADMSRDVWFPRFSGIRSKIDALHKRHPQGFQIQDRTRISRKQGSSVLRQSMQQHGDIISAKTAMEIAQIELDSFVSRKPTLQQQTNDLLLEESNSDDVSISIEETKVGVSNDSMES